MSADTQPDVNEDDVESYSRCEKFKKTEVYLLKSGGCKASDKYWVFLSIHPAEWLRLNDGADHHQGDNGRESQQQQHHLKMVFVLLDVANGTCVASLKARHFCITRDQIFRCDQTYKGHFIIGVNLNIPTTSVHQKHAELAVFMSAKMQDWVRTKKCLRIHAPYLVSPWEAPPDALTTQSGPYSKWMQKFLARTASSPLLSLVFQSDNWLLSGNRWTPKSGLYDDDRNNRGDDGGDDDDRLFDDLIQWPRRK